jgi:geranylgeranyl reductase family protein
MRVSRETAQSFCDSPVIALSSPANPVIVLGAGPAGATAARALASRGIAVRLLDRAPFPRNKPCGGGISMRALIRFPYLERELSRIATHVVSRLYLEGPDRDSTVVESDDPAALMIRRVEFDALLVSMAQEAGAELVTGADVVHAEQDSDRVTLIARDGRRFRAPIVIAADGVHSVVARRLGINRGWNASAVALDMMEETPRSALRDVDPTTLWVSYGFNPAGAGQRHGQGAAEGYAYIFPKRDHVNIGVGYVLAHYRAALEIAPYELQRGFVAQLRDRGVVVGDSVRKNFTPFLIPVGGPLRNPASGRVLLAGDAGGFVNGFTAEGIYYAMVSGELAAKAVAAGGGVGRLAGRYCRACDDEIGAELRDSVLLQRYLFADRRRIAAVINAASRQPAAMRAILEFAVGRRSYGSLRRHLLARSPLLAGRVVWEHLRTNLVVRRAARS